MSNESARDGFGRALVEIARQDRNVITMDCDLGRSTRSFRITEVDPRRFIEMGIAEQNMVSTAAGLALMGKIVFVNSFAVFLTGRAFEQIRQQVSLPNANIKICGSSAGLTQGPDGATHQAVLDVALMRALPNLAVVVPADSAQAAQATWAAYRHKGPVYLRLSRYESGDYLSPDLRFQLGKAQELKRGRDIAVIVCGPVVKNALAAAQALEARGMPVSVFNFHTLKPLDLDACRHLAAEYRLIACVEEHSVVGGLGTAVAEVIAELPPSARRARLLRLGVQDTFGESGTADELLQKHGLSCDGIATSILRAAERL